MKIIKESQEKILFQSRWITLKETPKGFQYLERKGKDSIAVFLIKDFDIDSFSAKVLIRYQPLPLDNKDDTLYACPITGSIDEGETPLSCAIREVEEESGYVLDPKKVISLGSYIVGTQTNEIVHMFMYLITPETLIVEASQDGSVHEAISKNVWEDLDELANKDYSACLIGHSKIYKNLLKIH